jgi:hypothetical protein
MVPAPEIREAGGETPMIDRQPTPGVHENFADKVEHVATPPAAGRYINMVIGKPCEVISDVDGLVTFKHDGSKTLRYLGKTEFEKRFRPEESTPSPAPHVEQEDPATYRHWEKDELITALIAERAAKPAMQYAYVDGPQGRIRIPLGVSPSPQSNLQPMAWWWEDKSGCLHLTLDRPDVHQMARDMFCEAQPLYAHPPAPEKHVASVADDVGATRRIAVDVIGKVQFEQILRDGYCDADGGGDVDGGNVVAFVVTDLNCPKKEFLPGRYMFRDDISDGTFGLIPRSLEVFEVGALEVPDKVVSLSQMKEVHRHCSFSVFKQAEPENVADGSRDREHWPQPNVEGRDGWRITSIDILREWFGGERYARDYEYLDANYGRQAQQVVDWLATTAPAPETNKEDGL